VGFVVDKVSYGAAKSLGYCGTDQQLAQLPECYDDDDDGDDDDDNYLCRLFKDAFSVEII
jgi:hypothetical protein